MTAAAATRGIVSHDWKAEQRSRGGTALVASEVVIVVQRQGHKYVLELRLLGACDYCGLCQQNNILWCYIKL